MERKKKRWAILNLNPCIDRNVYLKKPFEKDTLNRVDHTVVDYGGKGLNQAVAACLQGYEVEYYSFVNRNEYEPLAACLNRPGLTFHPVFTQCRMRMNIKILDGQSVGTECNEAGGPVTKEEVLALTEALLAEPVDVLSMGGSLPAGMDASAYADLIRAVKARYPGATVLLDCDGEPLKAALPAKPDYIKPNRRELAHLFGKQENDLTESSVLDGALRKASDLWGVRILCTLDREGSVYYGPEGRYDVQSVPVPEKGFSGAGDTYLAAFAGSYLLEGRSLEEALSRASRAASAKIAKEGTALPDRAEVDAMPEAAVFRAKEG